jgi:hypothetical protein
MKKKFKECPQCDIGWTKKGEAVYTEDYKGGEHVKFCIFCLEKMRNFNPPQE